MVQTQARHLLTTLVRPLLFHTLTTADHRKKFKGRSSIEGKDTTNRR